MAKSVLEAVMEEKAKMVPKKGYRVVGVDRFSPPGEAAYRVGDYSTKEEAEKKLTELMAAEDKKRDEAGDGYIATDYYIYDPATK
jgi:hypothetical protein